MKQKIYILGLFSSALIVLGTLFKINHWPLAGIMIAAGMILLTYVFLPVALVNHYRNQENRQNRWLYIITWLTSAVLFTGMLFKIQHWPGVAYLLLLALVFPFAVFLPVFLSVTSKIRNFNIFDTVSVLLLVAVISVFALLLAVDVSRDRIYDSLDLGNRYISVGKAVGQSGKACEQPALANDIDGIIKIIDSYKAMILEKDGVGTENWDKDAKALFNPLSSKYVIQALEREGSHMDATLENAIRKFIDDLKASPDHKELAAAFPSIAEYSETGTAEETWSDKCFLTFQESWVLVYLEGLKTNLKIIRSSL